MFLELKDARCFDDLGENVALEKWKAQKSN